MILRMLLLLIFFLLLQGFFSGMETGLVSIRRPRAENEAEKGSPRAKVILYFLNHPGLMISTVLIGVNISTVLASLTAKNLAVRCGLTSPAAFTAVTAVLSLLMLFCETVPKSYFRQDGFHRCGRFIMFFRLIYWILYVPAHLFTWFTSFLERLIRKPESGQDGRHIRENLKLFLRESESGGVLFSETSAVLDRTMDLHGMPLSSIMIPAERLVSVSEDTPLDQAFALCGKNGYGCVPVCSRDNPEEWKGVFFPADLLSRPEGEWGKEPVSSCMRPFAEAAGTDGIIGTLVRLKNNPASAVAVRGEDRRLLGMITMNRIGEELFGEK